MIRLIFTILIFINYTQAQVFSDYDYVGIKSSAMAGSVSTNTNDIAGFYQNPASLAGVNDNTLLFGQSNLYQKSEFPFQYIGVNYELPFLGETALTYQSFSTENSGVKLSSESTISFTKAKFLQKDRNSILALGYRLNYYLWEQSSSSGTNGDGSNGYGSVEEQGIGVDFGIIAGLRKKYWLGGFIKNINSPAINGQNLPRSISLSIGFNPSHKTKTSISMKRLLGRQDRQIKLGIEYDVTSLLKVMSGVQSNPNRLGIGVEYKILDRYVFGYSILTHHIMGSTHNFEVKIK